MEFEMSLNRILVTVGMWLVTVIIIWKAVVTAVDTKTKIALSIIMLPIIFVIVQMLGED